MTNVLVLYYSSYGHVETMAQAVAEGAGGVSGVTATVKRVAETVPREVAEKSGYKLDQPAPIAEVNELPDYDAIVIGTPTRYGAMCGQLKQFWDQTGALWFGDKLVGKVGSVFTSTASQHGGQETTIVSTHTMLLHLGMVVVGLPYTYKGQLTLDEITGGSPYGASTIAGGDGSRPPSENELAAARFQGAHVAEIAAKLK